MNSFKKKRNTKSHYLPICQLQQCKLIFGWGNTTGCPWAGIHPAFNLSSQPSLVYGTCLENELHCGSFNSCTANLFAQHALTCIAFRHDSERAFKAARDDGILFTTSHRPSSSHWHFLVAYPILHLQCIEYIYTTECIQSSSLHEPILYCLARPPYTPHGTIQMHGLFDQNTAKQHHAWAGC